MDFSGWGWGGQLANAAILDRFIVALRQIAICSARQIAWLSPIR
jgi:hypothetical protein